MKTYFKNMGLNYKKAFTLIELLVVIAIISLLSAVVLNSLAGAKMKANDTKIAEDLRQFRIAVELYFNDNHAYPPTGGSSVNNLNNHTLQYSNKSGWSGKLSFFVKTVEAATARHSKTQLCINFDNIASSLVAKKYLSSIPVHPYDNDEKGICYKALSVANTFSSYAPLTTQINVTGGPINKRTGFILGDTSSVGVNNLITATNAVAQKETPYPIGADGTTTTTNLAVSSADEISGIASGMTGNGNDNGVVFSDNNNTADTNTASSSDSGNDPIMYTLTVDTSSLDANTRVVSLYYDAGGSLSSFSSPKLFPAGAHVSLYVGIQDKSQYTNVRPYFFGCDDNSLVNGNCNVTMSGNKTIIISE